MKHTKGMAGSGVTGVVGFADTKEYFGRQSSAKLTEMYKKGDLEGLIKYRDMIKDYDLSPSQSTRKYNAAKKNLNEVNVMIDKVKEQIEKNKKRKIEAEKQSKSKSKKVCDIVHVKAHDRKCPTKTFIETISDIMDDLI